MCTSPAYRIDSTTILEWIGQYDGTCIILDNAKVVTYPEIVSLADRLSMDFRVHRQIRVVMVDVEIGWLFIPVLLAAMSESITVVPIDNSHHPEHTAMIKGLLRYAPVISMSSFSDRGKLSFSESEPHDGSELDELCDVALMMFTSGTTGTPKGVMLTDSNIWSNVIDIVNRVPLTQQDRIMLVRPLTHVSAITGELLAGLVNGCAIYVKRRDASPLLIWNLIRHHAISVFFTTPAIAALIANRSVQGEAIQSLHTLILSGERLTAAQARKIAAGISGVRMINAYGLTEASPRISCLMDINDSFVDSCVGTPLEHVKVRVVDSDGLDVGEGDSGELLVSGPNVMKGYYLQPELTKQKVVDGWLRTGDRAQFKEGVLYILGRNDNMMNRGGVNLYPEEIESIILRCPGVRQALAFPSHRSGKRDIIEVLIECDPGITREHLQNYYRDRKIDPRLRPDRIAIVDALPRNASGKLLRTRPQSAPD